MITLGQCRPECPAIGEDMRQALDDVSHGSEPKQAINDAGKKSANTLGW